MNDVVGRVGLPPSGGSAGFRHRDDEEVSLRDFFAAHAPRPSDAEIDLEKHRDRNANPYNEHHKPRPRATREIIADLCFEYADAMLKARKKGKTNA